MNRDILVVKNLMCEFEDCLKRESEDTHLNVSVRFNEISFIKFSDEINKGRVKICEGEMKIKRDNRFAGYVDEITWSPIAKHFPYLKRYKCFKHTKQNGTYKEVYRLIGKFRKNGYALDFHLDSEDDKTLEPIILKYKEQIESLYRQRLKNKEEEEMIFLNENLKDCNTK
jgi:hypothetical protein